MYWILVYLKKLLTEDLNVQWIAKNGYDYDDDVLFCFVVVVIVVVL
jgi:hypothetical protein